jgi:hypothetical protein
VGQRQTCSQPPRQTDTDRLPPQVGDAHQSLVDAHTAGRREKERTTERERGREKERTTERERDRERQTDIHTETTGRQ